MPPRIQPLSIAEIQRAVAAHFEVRLEDLLSDRQTRSVSRPRQVAMYLARELTSCSLPQIGRAFHRDHTTILHGIMAIERLLQSSAAPDEAFAWHVWEIKTKLRAAAGINRIAC